MSARSTPTAPALVLARWALGHLARQPWAWGLLALLVVLAWPLQARLAELGLASADRDPARVAGEWAFAAGVVAAALGLTPFDAPGSLVGRLPPGQRLGCEALTVLAVVLLAQAAVLVGVRGLVASAPGATLSGLALLDLHLCALALVALRAPLARGIRPALFLCAAWVVPALVDEPLVAALFDASRHLAARGNGDHTLTRHVVGLAPIAALLLAARVLAALRPPRT